MKTSLILIAIASTALFTSACQKKYRTTDSTVGYTSYGKGGGTTMTTGTRTVTRLPTGYRTREYRGVTYYEVDNVVYRRSTDGRAYTVVDRPW